MSLKIPIWKRQKDVHERSIKKALHLGLIERLDVMPEVVIALLPDKYKEEGVEFFKQRYGMHPFTREINIQWIHISPKVVSKDYWEVYRKTLDSIPVNYKKIRQQIINNAVMTSSGKKVGYGVCYYGDCDPQKKIEDIEKLQEYV